MFHARQVGAAKECRNDTSIFKISFSLHHGNYFFRVRSKDSIYQVFEFDYCLNALHLSPLNYPRSYLVAFFCSELLASLQV